MGCPLQLRAIQVDERQLLRIQIEGEYSELLFRTIAMRLAYPDNCYFAIIQQREPDCIYVLQPLLNLLLVMMVEANLPHALHIEVRDIQTSGKRIGNNAGWIFHFLDYYLIIAEIEWFIGTVDEYLRGLAANDVDLAVHISDPCDPLVDLLVYCDGWLNMKVIWRTVI